MMSRGDTEIPRGGGHQQGFSLVEVVIAMGIFALAIFGLVGVIGPMLADSSEEAAQADEVRVIGVLRGWFANTTPAVWSEGSQKLKDNNEPLEFLVYAWQANGEAAQWRCRRIDVAGPERTEAQEDFDAYGDGDGAFASAVYKLSVSHAPDYYPEPNNANNPPGTYRAMHAAVRRGFAPEPGTTVDTVLQTFEDRPITLQFNLGWRQP
jgi:prepilin-type N-terminal cleavage/methylation domain-containing protein